MSGIIQRVDESVESTPEDEYKSLLRSLRRRKGFGLVFVRCSPVGGLELIQKVQDDLPQKQIGVLALDQPIDNLIERVKDIPNQAQLNILFVVGLEKSLVNYIQTGYGGEGDYYNLDTIPPILSHLNWQRENFRDRFRHICFVFLLPQFAIKYIIRRAPDFYDWASSKTDISLSQELVAQESQRIEMDGDEKTYSNWSIEKRIERMIEIDELIIEPNQTQSHQASLLLEKGNIFLVDKKDKEAIICYDRALEINLNFHKAWNNRGVALGNLGRSEESIKSYDKALEINPEDYKAWFNRGIELNNLGRYEEAITSFNRALAIKPEYHQAWYKLGNNLLSLGKYDEASHYWKVATCIENLKLKPNEYQTWYNRGNALFNLGRYEEAIDAYDQALKIKPDYHQACYMRGFVLSNLGRHEEAIAAYDQALQIKLDYHEAWYSRGFVLNNLGRYEEAISAYDQALQIKPDYHEAWYSRGFVLNNLGRYEEAISAYDQALQIKPNYHEAWNNRGIVLGNLGRHEEAISAYDQALQIKPNYHEAWYNKASAYSLQNQIELALENLQKAIQPNPENYRQMAKTDSDFDNIRHDPRFQALIQ
jgi:tetratricopeptide (TPR) repeat protein